MLAHRSIDPTLISQVCSRSGCERQISMAPPRQRRSTSLRRLMADGGGAGRRSGELGARARRRRASWASHAREHAQGPGARPRTPACLPHESRFHFTPLVQGAPSPRSIRHGMQSASAQKQASMRHLHRIVRGSSSSPPPPLVPVISEAGPAPAPPPPRAVIIISTTRVVFVVVTAAAAAGRHRSSRPCVGG